MIGIPASRIGIIPESDSARFREPSPRVASSAPRMRPKRRLARMVARCTGIRPVAPRMRRGAFGRIVREISRVARAFANRRPRPGVAGADGRSGPKASRIRPKPRERARWYERTGIPTIAPRMRRGGFRAHHPPVSRAESIIDGISFESRANKISHFYNQYQYTNQHQQYPPEYVQPSSPE